jgi:hypothetical protein
MRHILVGGAFWICGGGRCTSVKSPNPNDHVKGLNHGGTNHQLTVVQAPLGTGTFPKNKITFLAVFDHVRLTKIKFCRFLGILGVLRP